MDVHIYFRQPMSVTPRNVISQLPAGNQLLLFHLVCHSPSPFFIYCYYRHAVMKMKSSDFFTEGRSASFGLPSSKTLKTTQSCIAKQSKPASVNKINCCKAQRLQDHTCNMASPLLRLPIEIRLRIYAALDEGFIGYNARMKTGAFLENYRRYKDSYINLVCRQIYNEAQPFLAAKGFQLYYLATMQNFISGMGIKKRQCLTRLKLVFAGGSPFRVLRYMRSCTSLKVLEIDAVLDPNEDYWIRRMAPFVRKNTAIKTSIENAIEAFVTMTATELVFGTPRYCTKDTGEEHFSREGYDVDKAETVLGLRTSLAHVRAEINGEPLPYGAFFDLDVLLLTVVSVSPSHTFVKSLLTYGAE
jgi:hypothetical protein